MDSDLILASGSPRRRDLLREAGFAFEVVIPNVEECEDPSINVRELTALNARMKGEAIAEDPGRANAVVLSADTLVLLGETVLGKPAQHD